MVLVTFKTLTQDTFTLDFDPTATVTEIKQKIADGKGEDYAVELQKFIFNGKIPEDSATFDSIGYEEKKFIVLMLGKKKTPEPEVKKMEEKEEERIEEEKKEDEPAGDAQSPANRRVTFPDPPETLSPRQTEKIANIVAMGYGNEEATAALQVSDWDADRGADLLLNGVNLTPQGARTPAPQAPRRAGRPEVPDVDEIRRMLGENPEALRAMIAEVAPDLATAMENNTISNDELARMLALVGINGGRGAPEDTPAAPAGVRYGRDRRGRDVAYIDLEQHELDAVNRIRAMGFPVADQAIVQAFLACDKNEELTINLILNSMEPEDDQ